jgi:hypothetical protein
MAAADLDAVTLGRIRAFSPLAASVEYLPQSSLDPA